MPVKPDKKSFSVTLPIGTYELLKRWAGERDWNVSQAARNMIAEALGKHYGLDSEELREGNIPEATQPSKNSKAR